MVSHADVTGYNDSRKLTFAIVFNLIGCASSLAFCSRTAASSSSATPPIMEEAAAATSHGPAAVTGRGHLSETEEVRPAAVLESFQEQVEAIAPLSTDETRGTW